MLLSATSNPPPRIQKWVLRLQSYNCTIRYSPGSTNPPSAVKTADQHIKYITPNAVPIYMDLQEIEQHTVNDCIIQRVTESPKLN